MQTSFDHAWAVAELRRWTEGVLGYAPGTLEVAHDEDFYAGGMAEVRAREQVAAIKAGISRSKPKPTPVHIPTPRIPHSTLGLLTSGIKP